MKATSSRSGTKEVNVNSLSAIQALRGILTEQEEATFMNIMFSSSATIRSGNFGISRGEVEKQLTMKAGGEEFTSFLRRINRVVGRYFQVIYDEKRDRVVVLMRVSGGAAKNTLTKESLALLLFIFYEQEVLGQACTYLDELLHAFGHETSKASQRILANLDPLKKIGAITDYTNDSNERSYELTAIGTHMFSDSFLRRMTEFSQSHQLNKDEVLKFFRRYNLHADDEAKGVKQ